MSIAEIYNYSETLDKYIDCWEPGGALSAAAGCLPPAKVQAIRQYEPYFKTAIQEISQSLSENQTDAALTEKLDAFNDVVALIEAAAKAVEASFNLSLPGVPDTPTAEPPSDSGTLGAGAIAGIAVGSVAVVAIGVYAGFS